MTNDINDSTEHADINTDNRRRPQVVDLETVMESIVRISFAGLGGSILGLGQKRRVESMRVLTGSAATAAARRKRSPMPSSQVMNLPWTMAVSCMAFVAIVETSRLTSPSSMILQGYYSSYSYNSDDDKASSSVSSISTTNKAMTTVGDFTIGGAVAGLAGSIGKTSQKRLLPVANTVFRGSKRFFGLLPGITLGIAFGSLQALSDYTIHYLEENIG